MAVIPLGTSTGATAEDAPSSAGRRDGGSPTPRRGGPAGKRARRLRHHLTGHAFLFGAMVCFTFFAWYPMVREIIMSFQRTRRGETRWVGWDNYERILNDPAFGAAWRNTLMFTVLALVIGYALPFFIAILLNELRHARTYLRIVVYLPVILPPAAGLLLFKYLYLPGDDGILNYLFGAVGLPKSQFVQDPSTTTISLVVASTWLNMGGAVLIYLAALQSIPGELYDAAEVDGSGVWRRIWHVTIPQCRLVLSLMLLLQVVATMQLFIEPFILAGGNGVQDSATSLVYLMYNHAFRLNDLNGAAALGVMLMIALLVFSGLYVWLSPKQED
jgi:multiple sugar transport system permease protein